MKWISKAFSIFKCLLFFNYYVCFAELNGSKKLKSSLMDSLKDFGYHFNEAGELRNIKSGESFVFDVYDGDKRRNQKRYEMIGKAVEKEIYNLLESETKLEKRYIPGNFKPGQPKGFLFQTPNIEEYEKIVIIIHGSGVVRAGQWSRRLIINHSLYSGTQIPYIQQAQDLGYGVLVLNTNQNHDEETNERIPESSDPDKHFSYVWRKIVNSLPAKYIAIIAHSYGGAVVVNAANKQKDFIDRVFVVALTDSVHGYQKHASKSVLQWFHNNVVNWVSSKKPLDEKISSSKYDCTLLSAGTPVHEETSWKAIDSVWKFIQEKYEERMKKEKLSATPVVITDKPVVENVDDEIEAKDIDENNDIYMDSQPASEDETGPTKINSDNNIEINETSISGNELGKQDDKDNHIEL